MSSEALSTTPFTLSPDVGYYSCWDSRLNPKMYIEKRFNCLSSTLVDDRLYDLPLIKKHLVDNGAILVEQESTIRSLSDKDGARGRAGLPSFLLDSENRYLYWYKDNLVTLDKSGTGGAYTLSLYWPCKPLFTSVHDELTRFLIPTPPGAARISILMKSKYDGIKVEPITFKPPVIDDLEMSYGKEFSKVHNRIVEKLTEPRAGIMCFHGPPGNGKSFYIKYLTTLIDRPFIFIPVGMASQLADPDFVTLLMSNKESILVLEDAEQALQSRERDPHNSNVVASLLNISDGLLGSLLNITIIATYNADKQLIDKALLRKGRLAMDYTFDKLSEHDARRLAAHLKKDPSQFIGPTSLADIYNSEDDTGYVAPVEKTMGFGLSTVTPK